MLASCQRTAASDPAQLAKLMIDIASGEVEEPDQAACLESWEVITSGLEQWG